MTDKTPPADDFRRLAVSMKPDDWALIMKAKSLVEAEKGLPVSLAEVVRLSIACLVEAKATA